MKTYLSVIELCMSMSSLETRTESISSESSLWPRPSIEVSTVHSVAAPGVGVVFSLEGLLPVDLPAKDARLDLHSCARHALEGDKPADVGEGFLDNAGVGDEMSLGSGKAAV